MFVVYVVQKFVSRTSKFLREKKVLICCLKSWYSSIRVRIQASKMFRQYPDLNCIISDPPLFHMDVNNH